MECYTKKVIQIWYRGMGCISKLQTNSIPDVTLNVKV